MVASEHYNTLLHFRFNPEHKAQRGRHGEGSNRTGREGESIELPVPVGTVVYDEDTGERLFDFTDAGAELHGRARAGAEAAATRASPPPRIRRPPSTKTASPAKSSGFGWN